MMNKQKMATVIAPILICFCMILGYELLYLKEKKKDYDEFPYFVNDPAISTTYTFDPTTIISSLEEGKEGLFTLVVTQSETGVLPKDTSLPLTQLDFLEIASALARIELKEDLNDWHIPGAYFEKECTDISAGFDSGSIIFFRYADKNIDYLHYQTLTITIDQPYQTISYHASLFARPLLGWTTIDLNKLETTANDALQIGEDNGGRTARAKVNNMCNITVHNNPNSGANWVVRYDTALLEIVVDTMSNRYRIVGNKR